MILTIHNEFRIIWQGYKLRLTITGRDFDNEISFFRAVYHFSGCSLCMCHDFTNKFEARK